MTRQRLLEIAAAAGLLGSLLVALAVPPEQTQGDLARLMFVHVPSAWLAYLAFIVTLVGSAMYLWKRNLRWDRLAAASAEVGVFFTGAALLTGMIWGKPTWGVWWTWEARLMFTAIMFFVYLGYLALRRAIVDREIRARRAAIFGVLAVIQIPVVHFSVYWWRTLHQPPSILRPGPIQMDAPFFAALMIALVAFTAVYVALVSRRMQLALVDDEIDALLGGADREVAGAAVTAPQLEGLADRV